jgi:inhibitor of KinA
MSPWVVPVSGARTESGAIAFALRENCLFSYSHFARMEIATLGDSALIVRIRDRFADAPEQTLNEVLAAMRCLEAAKIPGVVEFAPAYTTVAVFFDPVLVINNGVEPNRVVEHLTMKVREALTRTKEKRRDQPAAHLIEVPVCYHEDFALDLDDVANQARISPKEVIDLHCSGDYRVSCVGFTPGFPFLSGLPVQLATPRRATPRKEIPAGSVAIGGTQTGIYPVKSPGGWHIIGRMPLRLFDPDKNPPALLRAGDRVRFRSITREEFEQLKQ